MSIKVCPLKCLPAAHNTHEGIGIGAAIMIISLVLFENEFLNIVAISFTALILNELIMVALEITIWYGVILNTVSCSFLTRATLGTFTW